MKTLQKWVLPALILFVMGCGSDTSTNQSTSTDKTETPSPQSAPKSQVKASERIDLESKGVGPVTSVKLDPEIDRKLAVKGKEIYEMMYRLPQTRLQIHWTGSQGHSRTKNP